MYILDYGNSHINVNVNRYHYRIKGEMLEEVMEKAVTIWNDLTAADRCDLFEFKVSFYNNGRIITYYNFLENYHVQIKKDVYDATGFTVISNLFIYYEAADKEEFINTAKQIKGILKKNIIDIKNADKIASEIYINNDFDLLFKGQEEKEDLFFKHLKRDILSGALAYDVDLILGGIK